MTRMRFLRSSSVILSTCIALTAAELPSAPSGLSEFEAKGNAVWSNAAGEPTTADGGVTARHDGIRFACDHLSLIQDAIDGTTTTTLKDGALLAGPAGPFPDRVLLDTREARSPAIGFRGLMTPGSITINRMAGASRPGIVRFHLELPNTGEFSGRMRLGEEWAPFRGWSQNTVLEAEGSTAGGRVGDLRVVRIVLNGRPEAAGQERRYAEINRYQPAQADDQPGDPALLLGHIDAPEIVINFDAEGRASTRLVGARTMGDPRLFNTHGAGTH